MDEHAQVDTWNRVKLKRDSQISQEALPQIARKREKVIQVYSRRPTKACGCEIRTARCAAKYNSTFPSDRI